MCACNESSQRGNADAILQIATVITGKMPVPQDDYLITQQTLHNRRVLKINQRGTSQPVFIVREYQR